jgi:hypothetical protein
MISARAKHPLGGVMSARQVPHSYLIGRPAAGSPNDLLPKEIARLGL